MGWKESALKPLLHITILLAVCTYIDAAYKVGVGRADCTGPSVEITFVSTFLLKYKLLYFQICV